MILSPPPSKKVKGLSKILSSCFGNAEVQVTPQQRVKQEIAQYLTHPQLSLEDEPLPWWKSECVRYPVLAKVANKFCVCVLPVCPQNVSLVVEEILSVTVELVLNLRE